MDRTTVSVEVTRGDIALDRLSNTSFVAEWERLRATCAWATSFQSFAFVDCWYRLHEQLYEPVIVDGRDDQGRLVGLLTLARHRSGRLLVGAGDFHAEYQTWIANEPAVEPFLRASIDLLERFYPRGRLRLTYLPPRTPVGWADGDSTWPRRIHLRSRLGGFMDLSDPTGIEASLRKGHNRNRLNSLRRYGDVRLETIETVDALMSEIDEIAVLCDLRQGAVNDSLPFTNNPLKRPLHLELMERGLLHATVVRVGSTIASAHLDMKNGADVLIYLIAHAPAFARHSPGSLHILLLARELAGQGVARYDLSPGGGYKDRYATNRETVHRMTVQFGFADRIVADLSGRAVAAATTALFAVGRTPRSAQLGVRRLRARAASPFTRRRARAVRNDASVVLQVPDHANGAASQRLALDHPGDLLAYDSGRSGGLPLRRFLQLALHRLEAGHRVLTRMDGPMLAECWWLCRLDRPPGGRGTADGTDISTASMLLLYDPVMPAQWAGSEAKPDILDRLVSTLLGIAPAATTFLAVSAHDVAFVDALVGAGASRIGEVNLRPVAPSADARAGGTHVGPGLAPPLEELVIKLASGWPADHPDAT